MLVAGPLTSPVSAKDQWFGPDEELRGLPRRPLLCPHGRVGGAKDRRLSRSRARPLQEAEELWQDQLERGARVDRLGSIGLNDSGIGKSAIGDLLHGRFDQRPNLVLETYGTRQRHASLAAVGIAAPYLDRSRVEWAIRASAPVTPPWLQMIRPHIYRRRNPLRPEIIATYSAPLDLPPLDIRYLLGPIGLAP